MGELLGVRAYARRRGVSPPAVRKAIATGRLEKAVTVDERGRKLIDPALADREWKGGTDPAQQRKGQRELFEDGRSRVSRSSPEGISFVQHRALREEFTAQLKVLEFKEKLGSLVSVADVKAEAFECGRTVRDLLLEIGPRTGPILAGLVDPRRCEELVTKEIEAALGALTRGRDPAIPHP